MLSMYLLKFKFLHNDLWNKLTTKLRYWWPIHIQPLLKVSPIQRAELGGRYRKRYSSMSGYIEQTWIQMITGRTCFPKSIILIDYLIEPLPGKVCWSLLRAGGAAWHTRAADRKLPGIRGSDPLGYRQRWCLNLAQCKPCKVINIKCIFVLIAVFFQCCS